MKATGCKKIYNAENIIEAEMLAASPENMTMKIRAVLITMIISTALGSISSLKFPYDRYAITIQ